MKILLTGCAGFIGSRTLYRQSEQPADVPQKWVEVTKVGRLFDYKPTLSFNDGVTKFYKWQKKYCSFL